MADQFTEADGRQLAVDMLRELGDDWNNVGEKMTDAEAEADDVLEVYLRREPRILRRYLRVVRERRSAALTRGFLCVVSEYIGGAINGAATDEAFYETHEEARHAAR